MKPLYIVLTTIAIMLIIDYVVHGIANRRLIITKQELGPTSNVGLTPTFLETLKYVVASDKGYMTTKDF